MQNQSLNEEAIFQVARRIQPPEALSAYLSQACGADESLHARVLALLGSPGDADLFMEAPPSIFQIDAAATLDQILVEKPGTQIGPYKLLQQIGEGGMGAVYMAEQKEPIRRTVALKIIKPGMDTQQVVARFEAERQALAMMNHPNIAKVLDAGATESGRPFFVMELVKGIPITEYCDTHKLTTRQRLELLVTICDAIQHAHQKGIIHRDLKPGNLLVELHDVRPVPIVVDFGIAKSTNQRLTERTLCTNFSQMIGTPLYMSPEQAQLSGLDVDTRSDVYSLGVLLYELITGTTPFTKDAMSKIGYDEMRRKIQYDDPPRPSERISTLNAAALSTLTTNQRVDTRKLQQQVRNELDWVVMKALDKDRTRRYQTATAFAEDIQRYLNDEPVQACPPSLSYRLQKITRRYRVSIVAATVLLLTLLAATAFSLRSAYLVGAALLDSEQERVKTNNQRVRAEDALTTAEKERQTANEQRQLAEERRVSAEALEAEAIRQRDTVKRNLYMADIRLAATDLHNSNIPRLHRKLAEHIPADGSMDYRSWEWYYLQSASHLEQRTFYGHTDRIESVDWSPDGQFVASVGPEGVRIWNAKTGEVVYKNNDGPTIKKLGAWSPDGSRFAWGSAAEENAIRIWEIKSGEVVTLLGHTFSINSICWSPDGKLIASTQMSSKRIGDTTCRIWDIEKRKCVDEIRELKAQFQLVAWSPNRELLATQSQTLDAGIIQENRILIWNPKNGEQITHLRQDNLTKSLIFSPDGEKLIVGDINGRILVYDVNQWELLFDFAAHSSAIRGTKVNPSNSVVASCAVDGIHLWGLTDGKKYLTLNGHDAAVNSVAWDPTGNSLASGGSDCKVKIWNVAECSTYKCLSMESEKASAIEWDPSSERLVCSIQNGSIALVDINSRAFGIVPNQNVWIDGGVLPDENTITEYIKRVAKNNAIKPTQYIYKPGNEKTSNQYTSFCWSTDGERLITVIKEQVPENSPDPWKITVWNAFDGSRKHQWNLLEHPRSLHWAPDNRRAALAGKGQSVDGGYAHVGCVYIFDTETGKTIHKLRHGDEPLFATSVAWDPTGSRIASGNEMGLICIWDAINGKRIVNEVVHQTKITSLAWSPDQKRIASAAAGGQIKILDAETAEELMSLKDANSIVRQLSWSPDGRKLSGINEEGRVVIWDASRGYEYEQSEDYRNGKLYEKLTKAQEYFAKTEFDTALSLIEEFLTADSENLEALGLRGSIRECLNDRVSALADWTKIVTLKPDFWDAWYRKGMAEYQLAKWDEAIVSFTNAIVLADDVSEYFMRRGQVYERQSKIELAAEDFKKAAKLAPNGQAILNLGRMQIRFGLPRDAIKALTAVIAINSETAADCRETRAVAYISDGELEIGIHELETLIRDRPRDTSFIYLALAYISADKIVSYRNECKELVNGLTDDDQEIDALVWICSLAPNAISDYALLIENARSSVKKAPTDQHFHFSLGAILMRAGRNEEAKFELEKGIGVPFAQDSIVVPYLFLLAIVKERLGDHEGAVRQFDDAQKRAHEELARFPPWSRKLANQILRKEANEVVNGAR